MIQDRKAKVIDAIVEAAATGRLSAEQLLQRLLEELPSDRVMEFAADVGITEKDIVEAESGSTERQRWDDFLKELEHKWSEPTWVWPKGAAHLGLPYYDEKGQEYPSYEEFVCRD